MEIKVTRTIFHSDYTVGNMFIDTEFICNTLEDTVRPAGEKIPGKTAIPAGRFEVKLTYSNRFKKVMPEILNVPGFTGVRIHKGNSAADTDGCLLVGKHTADGWLSSSGDVYDVIFSEMEACKQPIFITIE